MEFIGLKVFVTFLYSYNTGASLVTPLVPNSVHLCLLFSPRSA